MITTPRKLVHWENVELSIPDFGSPFPNDDSSNVSMLSTSSMEYVNSQLVAHGFAAAPGLSLVGTSPTDAERVIKCLLGMLGQRVEDMLRTEELTTKYRTLSYDHERLMGMHRAAVEKAANAERDTNLHKTRLTATLRTLQSTENAQKQTAAELQRTRTSLQAIRSAHQFELKKKEKDIERMNEKWMRLADNQAKLSSTFSGMRCANAAVIDGGEVIGKGQGFLELALEQAEKARSQLTDENIYLKKLVLKAINSIQTILHQGRIANPLTEEAPAPAPPTPYTLSSLFPLNPADNAQVSLDTVLAQLHECLATFPQPSTSVDPSKETKPSNEEVQQLEAIIASLKEEIDRLQKRSVAQSAETRAMFDKFAAEHGNTANEPAEISVELISDPLRDEEREKLDIIRRELDLERQKFTEAAIKLGKERASLEAERVKLLDEKRSWQVEMMLADLPPTPLPPSPARPNSAHKSPRKAPHKVKSIPVGKVNERRTTRVSRNSLATPPNIVPAYQTEVMPPLPAPSLFDGKLKLSASLLPNTFVLPPPSPHASLPTQPALPPPSTYTPPDLETSAPATTSTLTTSGPDITLAPLTEDSIPVVPSTPKLFHLFPVAKPLAQRMIHAYSPVKPSPLSRILMLADSPMSPDRLGCAISHTSEPLEAIDEGKALFSKSVSPPNALQPQMSLAAELGVESPPDTPLKENKVEADLASISRVRGRVFLPNPNQKRRITTAEKGKKKGDPISGGRIKPTSAAVEKENNKIAGKVLPSLFKRIDIGKAPNVDKKPPSGKPVARIFGTASARSKTSSQGPPITKGNGGPRRVLLDSADAPPIGKGRKS